MTHAVPTGWTAANIPNLSGKVAIVTGSSSGLGLVAARELAAHGADLVLHGHDHCRATLWLDGPDKKIPAVGAPSASARTAAGDIATLAARATLQLTFLAHDASQMAHAIAVTRISRKRSWSPLRS